MNMKQVIASIFALFMLTNYLSAMADDMEPYGTAKVDMHKYPAINRVYDVNYDDPKKLNALVSFIKNVNAVVPGKVVVVVHGAEIRAFAKENYLKYQAVIDQLADLSRFDLRGLTPEMFCVNISDAVNIRGVLSGNVENEQQIFVARWE
ncbi:MAG: hypothetical protein K8F27_12160, partial [Sulfuricellaceae bacterium]|nr:hypothetical protein [Sulfuricellaceae bacterium]